MKKSTKTTKATKTKIGKLQLRKEEHPVPLLNKPAVTRVKVRVVRVVDGNTKLNDGVFSLIDFISDAGTTIPVVDWTLFTRIDLKFGNQSNPQDWYTITDDQNLSASAATLSAFLPDASNITSILYIAQGIQAKLQNAYDNGVQTVPLRLYTSLLPYNTTDPSKPINPYIFSIHFDYGTGPLR